MKDKKPEVLLGFILAEYEKAKGKHPPFHSPHEGYGILKEELDELWDEIRKRKSSKRQMAREAIQIGAVALKFLVTVCGTKSYRRPKGHGSR